MSELIRMIGTQKTVEHGDKFYLDEYDDDEEDFDREDD